MTLLAALLLILALLLVLAALGLAWAARRGQQHSGLPTGEVIYADTGHWAEVARPLFSQRYRLTGKPDYLVDNEEGLIPVEVKHTTAPAGGKAYASHVMQLAAYCLLVEDVLGKTPPCGLIRYRDATLRIPYDAALRANLLALLEAMRSSARAAHVPRSHNDAARCHGCGLRHGCDEAVGGRWANK